LSARARARCAARERTAPALELPASVCLRVTRACNARCGFCLAPADGSAQPERSTLLARVDWLLARGVKTVHFCGGEPTIHPALADLLGRVHGQGGAPKVTTNAIRLPAELLAALRATETEVKVSLHGDRAHHDRMVGCTAFEATLANLRRLVAASVDTSLQTTVVAGHEWVVERVAALALDLGVRRLSILPFLPRGHGRERRGEYELQPGQRRALRELVRRTRRALRGRLDVRWLDFTARPIHVVDADGRLVLEGATEGLDRELARLPERAAS